MREAVLREIFAEELEKRGYYTMAQQVRDGTDDSPGGAAALAAMRRAIKEAKHG